MQHIDIIFELERRGISGKRAGQNWLFCCPFHGEKNPSCGINVSKTDKHGLFGCFSCGERGNFYKLVSFLDKISYQEVQDIYENKMDLLVDVDGIKERWESKLNASGLLSVVSDVFFDSCGDLDGSASSYLSSRKINPSTINLFGVKQFRSLDWLNGRLALPIRDESGIVVSVTLRSIDQSKPKSYKLPGTDAKQVLYGLFELEQQTTIDQIKRLWVVEGDFDVMYLQQFGVPAVAIGGLVLTESQFSKLIQMKSLEKVYLVFDGDVWDGGKKERFVKTTFQNLSRYLDVEFLRIPNDPDDLTENEINTLIKKESACYTLK